MQVRVLSGVLKNMWCQTKRIHLAYLGSKPFRDKVPLKARCLSCKKNICLFIQECHDPGCFHLYMPPHKFPIKKKKKVSKKTFFKR